MNVIGLIAEYNPFHNGHIYQINKIKELYPNSIIIVILNGNFTQRGDASLINKWDKTTLALDNNVDLVIELPIYYGINNADLFAMASLKILNELKIDTLVFGTESDNITDLITIAKTKINNKEYEKLVKEYMDKGNNYPTSTYNAIKDLTNIFISTPNDILALSYIEEIIKNNYFIKPISIKRTNDYHSKDLISISSATAIREAIKNNIDIKDFVPKNTTKYINNIFIDDYFNELKYKIITADDISIYHDVKEGIDNRLKKYIYESNTMEEFISKVKNKRFTYNRIKRILLYILLDLKKDYKPSIYIRCLGFNINGSKYLNKIKKSINIPIISNYSENEEYLSLEYKANALYSLKLDFDKNIRNELNKPIIKENN